MADDSKEDVEIFPVQPDFLASLVESFPEEWKGVLSSLNSEALPLQKTCDWLEKHSSQPHWPALVDSLVIDFPVVLAGDAFFLPKILLLPLNIQRNILGLIHYNSDAIPCWSLEKLVGRLEQFAQTDDASWNSTLRKLLKSEVQHKRSRDESATRKDEEMEANMEGSVGKPLVQTEIISTRSKLKLVELCDKINATDGGMSGTCCHVYARDLWVLENRSSENQLPDFRNYDGGNHVSVSSEGARSDDETVIEGVTANLDVTRRRPRQEPDVEMIEILETPPKRCQKDESMDTNAEDLPAIPCPPDEFSDTIISKETGKVPSLLSAPPVAEVETVEVDIESPHPDKFPEVINRETRAEPASLLSTSLMAEVELLRERIQNLQGSHECPTHFSLSPLVTCTPSEMEEICIMLSLRELPESTSILLCQQFINLTVEPSYGHAVIFTKHLMLPRLQQVTDAASRVFVEMICSFAKKHPRAFCDGVVTQLIFSTFLGASQADVICKVISEAFTKDVLRSVLENIVGTQVDTTGSYFKWSEDVVTVIMCIINLKLDIFDKSLFESYVFMLNWQVTFLSKSLKFTKLLLATITKYPAEVKSNHDLFQSIVQNSDTFFKKAAITALKKVMK